MLLVAAVRMRRVVLAFDKGTRLMRVSRILPLPLKFQMVQKTGQLKEPPPCGRYAGLSILTMPKDVRNCSPGAL